MFGGASVLAAFSRSAEMLIATRTRATMSRYDIGRQAAGSSRSRGTERGETASAAAALPLISPVEPLLAPPGFGVNSGVAASPPYGFFSQKVYEPVPL